MSVPAFSKAEEVKALKSIWKDSKIQEIISNLEKRNLNFLRLTERGFTGEQEVVPLLFVLVAAAMEFQGAVTMLNRHG